MSDFINSITNLFLAVFNSMKSAPATALLVVALFFIGYYTISSNNILTSANSPIAVEQDRFSKVIIANNTINNQMEEIRTKIQADRITLRQFHNGKYGISGIPFTFVQTTYSVSAPGKGLGDQEAWFSYPIASMNGVLSRMFENGNIAKPVCITIYSQEVNDDYFKAQLNKYLVKYSVMCPLIDGDGYVVGYVSADYTTDRKLSENVQQELEIYVQPQLRQLGNNIVSELDIMKKEKSYFWEFWKK